MKSRWLPAIICLLVLIVTLPVLIGYYGGGSHNSTAPAAKVQETAFDRVMRTGTLRCGYAVATPWFFIDPNTGQKAGVDYDVTMAVAEKLNLKVEWTEETGWGVAEQGLASNHYDAVCGNVCIDANRTRAATFSDAFFSIPILAVVREDDHRFDAGLAGIDKPDVRIGVKSGHVFEYAAKERFPNAQRIYAADISDDTDFLLMLATNKVDIAFSGQSTIDIYNQKNPDRKVRSLSEPARFCHGAFMVPLGDQQLKESFDAAIMQMNTGGQLAKLMEKNVKLDPRYVLLPALPYRDPR